MNRIRLSLAFCLLSMLATAQERDVTIVPVLEEPLHVVRYRSDQFIVYTNWIEAGKWTLYHAHDKDLLAVIAADASVTWQVFGKPAEDLEAPAGAAVFFPYADLPEAYVHRLTSRPPGPFVNVGLEFQNPPESDCSTTLATWAAGNVKPYEVNRRGRPYQVQLSPGMQLGAPKGGSALLLVPLGPVNLSLNGEAWTADVGDHRLYHETRLQTLENTGAQAAALILFHAC